MMKAQIRCFTQIITSLLLLSGLMFAQGPNDLIIEPGAGVFLNEVIAGDTTANGDRVDLDRVYVLRRDGAYFVNYQIEADGFDLRIKAEDGAGTRPVIYSTTNAGTGNFPGEQIRITGTGGNVWVEDLVMVGYLEALAGEIGNIPAGLFRTATPGFDIVINRCILTNTRGQHIRTQSACRVVKITNSIFANMGDLGRSNFGAGKGIDLRDTSCDTLLMRHNTFVNFQDRIVRHRSSTAALNTFIFDHNTIVNGMSFHGTLALGWVGDKVQITNNLFMDTFVAGNDTDAVRQSEFDESGELDPFGGGRMTWIFSVPNDTTEWQVSNNYYSVSPEVEDFYTRHTAAGVTGEGSPLTWHINSKLGADSVNAFVKEGLSADNIPAVMVDMADWYRDCTIGACKTKATTNFVRDRDDFDRRSWQYYDDTLSVRYATSSAAYSGDTNGEPVGDHNWWQDVVGIDDITGNAVVKDFQLEQNYPNPFNPTTEIVFTLPQSGAVQMEVYNSLGQVVTTLVNGKLPAGKFSVTWDGGDAPSGIYFYRLTVDNNSTTRKMILMK